MTARRRAAFVLTLGLLSLLVVSALQASEARVSILWRASVLSWDSPATQLLDELASQGLLYADPARQAREQATVGLRPAGRLALPSAALVHGAVAVGSHLTRSPPLV
jgi:hypothetical protein